MKIINLTQKNVYSEKKLDHFSPLDLINFVFPSEYRNISARYPPICFASFYRQETTWLYPTNKRRFIKHCLSSSSAQEEATRKYSSCSIYLLVIYSDGSSETYAYKLITDYTTDSWPDVSTPLS